ncbi:MAG: hypothetical protein PWQ57_1183 [Desulfovibrionales bacterium]|nr:hypothetical protein [Desulfovibrionales bacterium]
MVTGRFFRSPRNTVSIGWIPLLVLLSFLVATEAFADGCPQYSTSGGAGFTQFTVAPNVGLGSGNYTNISFYYPNNATANKSCVHTMQGSDGAQTIYLQQGGVWQILVENNLYHQPSSCYIQVGATGWTFANGCSISSPQNSETCGGCQYMNAPPATSFNPGWIPQRYAPPSPDNVQGTQRIHIKNNCADDIYLVLTPPTGDDELTRYNAQLWNVTATKGGFTIMYPNPQNASSGLLFQQLVPSGDEIAVWAPNGGIASGNFGVLLGCTGAPSGPGQWPTGCIIGGIPGQVTSGVGTVFEYTAGCMPGQPCSMNPSNGNAMGAADYFDLSMVSGFSVPMSMEVVSNASGAGYSDFQCNFQKMRAVADLYDCPNETSATVGGAGYSNSQLDSGVGLYVTNTDVGRAGCMAPEQWLQGGQNPVNSDVVHVSAGITTSPNIADWYACNGMPQAGADANPDTCLEPGCGGPQCAVGPKGAQGDYSLANLAKGLGKPFTNYVKYLKAVGSQGYAWQFNDDASTMVCQIAGADVRVTICPGNPGQTPYAQQKWAFANGECGVDSNGSYASLLACMKANFDYACASEVVEKKRSDGSAVTASLYYCKPVAKGTTGAVSYDTCMANNTSICQSTGTTPSN